MDLSQILFQAQKEARELKNIQQWEDLYRKYLGKKGKLSDALVALKDLTVEERKKQGQAINHFKQELTQLLAKTQDQLRGSLKAGQRFFDVSSPAVKIPQGHGHPIMEIRRQMEEIFGSLGFSVIEGQEVTSEYYNFDALNIPGDHPARDAMDTFWLGQNNQRPESMLLRTHTSAMQVPYMECHQPPFKIIIPGMVYRYEATDASHDYQFYQLEGLMIDRDISIANFKGVIDVVFQRIFNRQVKTRLRPGFFPFTEPSFEIDLSCVKCQGKGCTLCKQTGWLEIMGAGMVHPNVLRSAKLDHSGWQGFAFGMGLGRIAMIKWGIDDIRLFFSGDLRFLKQF